MDFVLSIFLYAVYLSLFGSTNVLGHEGCERPFLNISILHETKDHGGCFLLNRVCADDGMLVTFDKAYIAENLTRSNPYSILRPQSGLWNFPTRGGSNSDALVGHQPNYIVAIRPASRREASLHLLEPVFSPCTMPVIMWTDWPYNMHEVMAQLAGAADMYFRKRAMIDDLATLVLATPSGLGMLAFHEVLLGPHSRYPVISLEQLSQRPLREQQVPWSQEGFHVSCFERAVLCKLHGFPQPMGETIPHVLKHIKDPIPVDPLGFSPLGLSVAEDTTLRVLIELRNGATRNIKNIQQIIDACAAANTKGFQAGPFTGLVCKVLNTADTPTLHGTARFVATVGAVRAAHVLVAAHGAGAANSNFLESLDGGTALMEIRPCSFGTRFCGWPDAYMRSQLEASGNVIRFFAYNVEDPAQCSPSDFDGKIHVNDDMRARDQHMTLAPGSFIAMLRHIGSLLRNKEAYDKARATNRLHGYPLPQGLVLGGLCIQDMDAHLRSGAPVLTE